jgi:hypothetical protein
MEDNFFESFKPSIFVLWKDANAAAIHTVRHNPPPPPPYSASATPGNYSNN